MTEEILSFFLIYLVYITLIWFGGVQTDDKMACLIFNSQRNENPSVDGVLPRTCKPGNSFNSRGVWRNIEKYIKCDSTVGPLELQQLLDAKQNQSSSISRCAWILIYSYFNNVRSVILNCTEKPAILMVGGIFYKPKILMLLVVIYFGFILWIPKQFIEYSKSFLICISTHRYVDHDHWLDNRIVGWIIIIIMW